MIKLFITKETRKDLIIRWGDALVLYSNFEGLIDVGCFSLEHSPKNPYTEDEIERIKNDPARHIRNTITKSFGKSDNLYTDMSVELMGYKKEVKNHLLHESYIKSPDLSIKWVLTDRGKLMKELGGHKAFKKHRKREINALKYQTWINMGLIIATALAAIMPFIVANYYPPKVTFNPKTTINVPQYRLPQYDTLLIRKIVDDEMLKTKSIPKQETPK